MHEQHDPFIKEQQPIQIAQFGNRLTDLKDISVIDEKIFVDIPLLSEEKYTRTLASSPYIFYENIHQKSKRIETNLEDFLKESQCLGLNIQSVISFFGFSNQNLRWWRKLLTPREGDFWTIKLSPKDKVIFTRERNKPLWIFIVLDGFEYINNTTHEHIYSTEVSDQLILSGYFQDNHVIFERISTNQTLLVNAIIKQTIPTTEKENLASIEADINFDEDFFQIKKSEKGTRQHVGLIEDIKEECEKYQKNKNIYTNKTTHKALPDTDLWDYFSIYFSKSNMHSAFRNLLKFCLQSQIQCENESLIENEVITFGFDLLFYYADKNQFSIINLLKQNSSLKFDAAGFLFSYFKELQNSFKYISFDKEMFKILYLQSCKLTRTRLNAYLLSNQDKRFSKEFIEQISNFKADLVSLNESFKQVWDHITFSKVGGIVLKQLLSLPFMIPGLVLSLPYAIIFGCIDGVLPLCKKNPIFIPALLRFFKSWMLWIIAPDFSKGGNLEFTLPGEKSSLLEEMPLLSDEKHENEQVVSASTVPAQTQKRDSGPDNISDSKASSGRTTPDSKVSSGSKTPNTDSDSDDERNQRHSPPLQPQQPLEIDPKAPPLGNKTEDKKPGIITPLDEKSGDEKSGQSSADLLSKLNSNPPVSQSSTSASSSPSTVFAERGVSCGGENNKPSTPTQTTIFAQP